MVNIYRKKFAGMAYQLAREDPELVLEFIEKLKKSGEIEPDELQHIGRIARKWVRINQENREKGRRQVLMEASHLLHSPTL